MDAWFYTDILSDLVLVDSTEKKTLINSFQHH